MIPSQWRAAKRFTQVLGRRMAYVESGAGPPIVLLHGNPTSSYLWRSVLPALAGLGRCSVPDLIGMGDSDKLRPGDPGRYTFACHREFVDGLLETLGADHDVVLVVHDWGSALGFDWARRHPGQVRAVAYMEALVRPLAGWDEWPGSILTGAVRDFCRTWPDQAEVTVPGIHFVQDDSGAEIGHAIATWLRQLPAEPGDG